MPQHIHLLLSLCVMAIGGLLAVQFYWIRNYYAVSKINFERDVNLSFEDAIKKEFSLRNDTIESLLVNRLMDTSIFRITTDTNLIPIDTNSRNKRVEFLIIEVCSNKQLTGFAYNELNRRLVGDRDTSYKRKVAQHFAHDLRIEDLENHVVFYRTQVQVPLFAL